MNYAVAETMELEYHEHRIGIYLRSRGFLAHAIQILQFYLKIIQMKLCLMRDFSNIDVMKRHIRLEKETG